MARAGDGVGRDGDGVGRYGDGFGFGVEGRWKLDERWGLMREIGGMRSLMRNERAWWDDEKKRKRLQRAGLGLKEIKEKYMFVLF